MELKIENRSEVKKLELSKRNLILGKNGSGKTSILELIKKGFEGKQNNFLYNGIVPPLNLFNIVHIEEKRDINSEIELKAKSYVKTEIIRKFSNENIEKIEELSAKYLLDIKELFKYQKGFEFELSQSRLDFTNDKIIKLENFIFELIFNDKLSISAMEEFYIRVRLDNLSNERYNLILIDNIDRYLDHSILKVILDNLPSNVYLIATSNNKYILNEINFDTIYDTKCRKINFLEEAKFKMFEEYLEREEPNETLDDYITKNNEFYTDKDYKKYFLENKLKVLDKVKL